MKKIFWITSLISAALLGYATYQALHVAPSEATMGDLQRIFYLHVPSAWIAIGLCLPINAIASAAYLIRRNSRFAENLDALAVSSVEVGLLFCTCFIALGMVWARSAWGIWWAWDARGTTVIVLYLIYFSYLLVRRFSGAQTGTIAAIFAMFAFCDIPLVYMSNRWWRTQHPAPVIGGGEDSGLDPHMLTALLWNVLAFTVYALLLLFLRYKMEMRERALRDRELALALAGPTVESFQSFGD